MVCVALGRPKLYLSSAQANDWLEKETPIFNSGFSAIINYFISKQSDSLIQKEPLLAVIYTNLANFTHG